MEVDGGRVSWGNMLPLFSIMSVAVGSYQSGESISVLFPLQDSVKGLLLEILCISKSLLFSVYPLFE